MVKLVAALIVLLNIVGRAHAAVGTELDRFSPNPSGNGRGITVTGPTSTTAYYSTYGSEDLIYKVDLKTHEYKGTLDTDLETTDPGRSYGALSWEQATGRLWVARYKGDAGKIGWIDPTSGHFTHMFDAHDSFAENVGIDGLAVDSDGTLFVSADGLGLGTTRIFHYDSTGTVLGYFEVPFGNSGVAIDGNDLWLANIDGRTLHKYTKTGESTGISFPTPNLDPEGLTIDYCSFQGKKAVWLYSAGLGGSPMAAFEIGESTNPGCAATPTPTPAVTATPCTSSSLWQGN